MPETIPGLTGRSDRMSRPNPTGFVQPPSAGGRTETALQRRKRARLEANEWIRRKNLSNAARRTRRTERRALGTGVLMDKDRQEQLTIAVVEGVSEEEARSIQVRERQAKESGQRVAEFIDQDRLNSPTALIELRHKKKLEILEANRKIAEEDRVLKAAATERKRLVDKQADQDRVAARKLAVEKSVESRQTGATVATTRRREDATVREQRKALDKQATEAISRIDKLLTPKSPSRGLIFSGHDANRSGSSVPGSGGDEETLKPRVHPAASTQLPVEGGRLRRLLEEQRELIVRSRSDPEQAVGDSVELILKRRQDIREALINFNRPDIQRQGLKALQDLVVKFGAGAFNVKLVRDRVRETVLNRDTGSN